MTGIMRGLLYLKNRWGLLLMLVISSVIFLSSVKPSFYIIGWDNFSAYLNLQINLPRTLLSAWREYRGVGVQSDSEVTDIFRQIPQLLISPLVKPQLLEFIYILTSFLVGIISLYSLGKLLIGLHNPNLSKNKKELVGFMAAFFYLFNLNTLATFFFPMPMFVARFAFIPTFIYLWIKITSNQNIGKKTLLVFLFVTLFGSITYLTSTVFFTILALLTIITLFSGVNLRKNLLLFFLFILINSFWLFPFINYTKNKAGIITLASTYTDVNESQLNEPSQHFSWDKILTLHPNFFYTYVTDINDAKPISIFRNTEQFTQSVGKIVSLFFPLLYIMGALLILFRFRSNYLVWTSFSTIFFVILIRKEYPPLGFLYDFLGKYIPYFKVVFRFTDTKFYPLIAFAGSMCAAIAILWITSIFEKHLVGKRKLFILTGILVVSLHIYTFKSYFDGNFISPLMYNKIPRAYFDITNTINSDNKFSRVLHLPLEQSAYWKSYSWGYMGSSFFSFLLDKPLIDRTFAPASLENDYINQSILNTVENVQSIYSPKDLEQRALKLYNLLKKTGTKYVIWDGTVTKELFSRGKVFWGNFQSEETKRLLDFLYSRNKLQLIKQFDVNLSDSLKLYSDYKKLSETNFRIVSSSPLQEIILYQLPETLKPIRSVEQVNRLPIDLPYQPELPIITTDTDFLQESKTEIISPFYSRKNILQSQKNKMILDFPIEVKDTLDISARQTSGVLSKQLIDIYTSGDEETKSIYLYYRPFPTIQSRNTSIFVSKLDMPARLFINGQKENLSDYLSDWNVLNTDSIGTYRISIDGMVIPLPAEFTKEPSYLGSVLVGKNSLLAELLEPFEETIVDLSTFDTTSDPNCLLDKDKNYKFEFDKTSTSIILSTKNGSSCITKELGEELGNNPNFAEFTITYDLEKQTEEKRLVNNNLSHFQQNVKDYVTQLPIANYVSFCILDNFTQKCLNNHKNLSAEHASKVIIPLQKTNNLSSSRLLMSLPAINEQKNKIAINSINVTKYKSRQKYEINMPDVIENAQLTNLPKLSKITLEIPRIISENSQFYNERIDAFTPFDRPCENPLNFRTVKRNKNITFIYNEDCQNGIALRNNFDSGGFYLWTAEYNLLAGRYPKYILKDDLNNYTNEYLSLYTGYPNVAEFKKLQKIDDPLVLPFETNYYQQIVKNEIDNLTFVPAYTFIYAHPELSDFKDKLFSITQNPSNQGIVAFKNMNIIELPTSWQNMIIRSGTDTYQYNNFLTTKVNKILPSLWKIEIKPAPNKLEKKNYLLEFDQGYDNQWKIYKNSITDTFLGLQNINANHVKINGWSNGWEINENDLPGEKTTTFYIFYTPERLAVLGWIITFLTILIVPKVLRKYW